MVLLKDFDAYMPHQNLSFKIALFWVQLHNLSLGGMNRNVGKKVGSILGTFEDVDVDSQGDGWGNFLSIPISIDLS